MSNDFLADRRRGAEEAFFARQNEALRVQLRPSVASAPDRKELNDASGITDVAVLDSLASRNVGPEGAAALSLIPLVVVAWADGELEPKERDALLKAAENAGLDRAGAGYKLFQTWLGDEPPPALLGRWKEFVGALVADMTADERSAFGDEIIGKARAVAEAAGGFLGIGRVSEAEEAVLDELGRSLRG